MAHHPVLGVPEDVAAQLRELGIKLGSLPDGPVTDMIPPDQLATQRKLVLDGTLVITFGNLKGGVGKTTSAWFLACYFAFVHGLRVLVVDADPGSQTGYSWHRKTTKRGVSWPFDFKAASQTQILADFLEDVQELGYYQVILIDSGGESDAILKIAVERSHELVIVASTSESEQERIPGTFEAAQEAGKRVDWDIEVRVLITKVPTTDQGKAERKTRADLAAADYPTFEACLHMWKHYYDSYNTVFPLNDLGEYYDVGEELLEAYYPEEEAA